MNIKCFLIVPSGEFLWNDGIGSPLYRRIDKPDDPATTLESHGVGAMWLFDADWAAKGPDGRSLAVVCPDGDGLYIWYVDSRASNCTMPNDNEHRCWVRHGDPPNVHVDKDGLTCAAGAGSIHTRGWHGYLHHGFLHD